MNSQRSSQLAGICQLYELRERESLARLNEQRACVTELERKLMVIQNCIDEFVGQLNAQDEKRLHTQSLTVDFLQEDAASRLVVERDLRKERFYLETATKDLNEAAEKLKSRHAQWWKHHQQVEAMAEVKKKHATLEVYQASMQAERELDETALNRHGMKSYG